MAQAAARRPHPGPRREAKVHEPELAAVGPAATAAAAAAVAVAAEAVAVGARPSRAGGDPDGAGGGGGQGAVGRGQGPTVRRAARAARAGDGLLLLPWGCPVVRRLLHRSGGGPGGLARVDKFGGVLLQGAGWLCTTVHRDLVVPGCVRMLGHVCVYKPIFVPA